MHIGQTAVSLNVPDPTASAQFLQLIGFTIDMEHDGVISLSHPDGGPNVIFLRTGLTSFKPAHRAGSAGEGTLLVFVVDSVDDAHSLVASAGGKTVTPPETEPWGERYCQFEDPNGLIIQFVEWITPPDPGNA